MGRAGTWFEYQREGIVPDVVVVAKVLTAGHMPLGGLVAREEVAAAFQGPVKQRFIAGTTLGGTPLACAAALATIEVVADEGLLERAAGLGERALPRLLALQERSRILAEVRVRGAMMGIEWVADRETDEPFADPEAVKARAWSWAASAACTSLAAPPTSLIWIPPSNIEDGPFDHLLSAVEDVVAGVEREFAR